MAAAMTSWPRRARISREAPAAAAVPGKHGTVGSAPSVRRPQRTRARSASRHGSRAWVSASRRRLRRPSRVRSSCRRVSRGNKWPIIWQNRRNLVTRRWLPGPSADFHVPFLDVSRDGPYLPARGFRLARDRRRGLIAAMGAQEMAEAIDEVAHLELHRSFEFVMPLEDQHGVSARGGRPRQEQGSDAAQHDLRPRAPRDVQRSRGRHDRVLEGAHHRGEVSSSGEPSYLRGHRSAVALSSPPFARAPATTSRAPSCPAAGRHLRVLDAQRSTHHIAQLQKLTGHEAASSPSSRWAVTSRRDPPIEPSSSGRPATLPRTSSKPQPPIDTPGSSVTAGSPCSTDGSTRSVSAPPARWATSEPCTSARPPERRVACARIRAPSAPGGVAFDTSAVPETSTRAVDGGFGILQVLCVPEEHLLLTLAYDRGYRAYDARTGIRRPLVRKPKRRALHRMRPARRTARLYLSDREGYLWVYDVFDGGVTIHEQVTGVAKVSDEVKRGSLAPATSVALLHDVARRRALGAGVPRGRTRRARDGVQASRPSRGRGARGSGHRPRRPGGPRSTASGSSRRRSTAP